MKELSIEEKVYDGNYKNYAELINRLEDVKEAIKKQNYGIAMDVLCKPYPEFQVTTHSELKDSEDKNIRKLLIEAVIQVLQDQYCSNRGVSKEKVVAWLEKQGNLMKALQISNAKIGELIEKNYYLKEQLEKQGNNMGISETTKKELEANLNKALEKEIPESWNKFLDEQGEHKPTIEMITPEESLGIDSETYSKIVDECIYGEQKPAWTEEDERERKHCIDFLNHPDLIKATPTIADNCKNWLKSLKNKVILHSQQEWSEEDKMMLQYAIEHFERQKRNCIEGGGRKKSMQEFVDWLKSLRPQNRWISVDKEVYIKEPVLAQKKDKSDLFKGYVVCCDHTLDPFIYERYISLDNCSQPTWKPSDEQMKQLHKYCPDNRPLTQLYQDLKKLKE